jgi:hypothetical protein
LIGRNSMADQEPHEPSIAELKLRIQDLEMQSGQQNMALAVAFKLPLNLKSLMGLLLSNVHVTDAIVVKYMPKVKTPTKNLIRLLRVHLKPYGVGIHMKRGVGYWFDQETKERIRERAFLDADNRRKPNCPAPEPAPKPDQFRSYITMLREPVV